MTDIPKGAQARHFWLLLSAVSVLSGAMAGLAAWSWTSARSQPAAELLPAVAAMQAAVSELGQRLAQLAETVADATRLAQPAWAGAPAREALPAPSSDALPREVQRLSEVVSELRSAVQELGRVQAAAQKGGVQLSVPVVPPDPSGLEALLQQPEVERDLRHSGWTEQQVLDAYGRPERMGPSPGGVGHKWYYRTSSGRQLIFWFVDQRVSKVFD